MAIITPGEPFHVIEAGKDWLMNWYVVRKWGVVLFGPPASAIIDPITQEEYVEAVRQHAEVLSDWVAHGMRAQQRKGQAYAILTMCRALYTTKNGGPTSKKQAALWAQGELPQWATLIQNALAWRQAWREEQVDHAATHHETVRFVNFVRDRIAAKGAGS